MFSAVSNPPYRCYRIRKAQGRMGETRVAKQKKNEPVLISAKQQNGSNISEHLLLWRNQHARHMDILLFLEGHCISQLRLP